MLVKINDTEIFYTAHGRGRPMLLMHGGLGVDHTYFRPYLDHLGKRGIKLIYYDHRGNGRSARPESFEGVGFDTWAADADALRSLLGCDRIILYGNCYGGLIAQYYALQYENRLDGLILDCTYPAIDYPGVIIANARARGTEEQVNVIIKSFSEPAADDTSLREGFSTILPLYFKNYDREAGERMINNVIFNASAYNCGNYCLSTLNIVSRLHEISAPTLIIGGRHDWIAPPAQGAERLRTLIPNSKLVIFENSGHFPFIEEQDKFINTVADWIAELHMKET